MFRLGPSSGSEWLFSRVLASRAGGPGSIPGRDMSVSGPLVSIEMTLVMVLYNLLFLLALFFNCQYRSHPNEYYNKPAEFLVL
jgi:hypothetical protein